MKKANQKLLTLGEFWERKRNGDKLPCRSDFDPKTLRPWIGNLAVVEITIDGELLFRICGTNLHGRFGGEFTGRDVGSLPTEIAQPFRKAVIQTCRTRAPLDLAQDCIVSGEAASFRDIYLPLSDDSARVNTILFASFQVLSK